MTSRGSKPTEKRMNGNNWHPRQECTLADIFVTEHTFPSTEKVHDTLEKKKLKSKKIDATYIKQQKNQQTKQKNCAPSAV